MDRTFIEVEGSEESPIARLSAKFQRASDADGRFAIYVFWKHGRLERPNWAAGDRQGKRAHLGG